jgi:cell wall-associated NlpC family hydrolase
MRQLDKRLNVFRPDLADSRLQGKFAAERFVEGRATRVGVAVASVHREPHFDAMQITQALPGEDVIVFEENNGWAWVQLADDGYVGYLKADHLTNAVAPATHKIAVPSSFLFAAPDIKAQPARSIPMLAKLTAVGEDDRFLKLSNGLFALKDHTSPVAVFESDPSAVALRFLNAPYYWGGKTAAGLDCSGLVQLALMACGINAPRDSDMLESAVGEPLPDIDTSKLQRNDLVFWKGHVGIMTDSATLLHANGHFMLTVEEPLVEAQFRIARTYGNITSIRRLKRQ